jgi:hypothetical protein
MMPNRGHDAGQRISAIIDRAVADMSELTMEREAACVMLACQAIVRIDDNEERRSVAEFAAQSVWVIDDSGGD